MRISPLTNKKIKPKGSGFSYHLLHKACVCYFFENLREIKFKNLYQIAITASVYLYKHCQKTKTLCRHVSCFPTFTA